jgi:DNA-binding MarR family transcriptional regulator
MPTQRYHLPYLESVRQQRHVCFAEQLRSANRAITRCYAQHLGDADIGIAQLSVLIRLYYFGEITISALARNLETDRTTLTRNLQLLAKSGHLEMVGGEDRRQRRIRLTDHGFASLQRTIPRWLKAQEDLRSRLGAAQWDALFAGLRVLATLDALDPDEAPEAQPRRRRARKPSDATQP